VTEPTPRALLSSIESEYRRYKDLGERAFGQLDPEQLKVPASAEGNSVAVIAWHVAGNLTSRFTDFLTTDGEKPGRDRESEFAARDIEPGEVRAKWEDGWSVLFDALAGLSDADLSRTVKIRGQDLSVAEALHRSLAHAAYHVGQIVLLARTLRGGGWHFLSIPPGKSDEYNRNPTGEKGRRT
jgi:uncharacterized damage-inducible protein DinB